MAKIWLTIRFILFAIVGRLVPLRIASVTLLIQELKNNGISPSLLPSSCIDEIAHEILHTAQLVAKYGAKKRYTAYTSANNARNNLVLGTEFAAERIAELLSGRVGHWDDQIHREARVRLKGILVKHGVSVP